jgi:hypothetical protein
MGINVQGYRLRRDEKTRIDNAHHAIVKWMLYKHRSFSLGYVLCALPIIAFVTGYIEISADNVMVRNILKQIRLVRSVVRWVCWNVR